MRLTGVVFALWAGNTKPVISLPILDRNRKSRHLLGERMVGKCVI